MASGLTCPPCPSCKESHLSSTASIVTLCIFGYAIAASLIFYFRGLRESSNKLQALINSTFNLYQDSNGLLRDVEIISNETQPDKVAHSRATRLKSTARETSDKLESLVTLARRCTADTQRMHDSYRSRGRFLLLQKDLTEKHAAAIAGVSTLRAVLSEFATLFLLICSDPYLYRLSSGSSLIASTCRYRQNEESLYRRRHNEILETQHLISQRQHAMLEEMTSRLKALEQSQQHVRQNSIPPNDERGTDND